MGIQIAWKCDQSAVPYMWLLCCSQLKSQHVCIKEDSEWKKGIILLFLIELTLYDLQRDAGLERNYTDYFILLMLTIFLMIKITDSDLNPFHFSSYRMCLSMKLTIHIVLQAHLPAGVSWHTPALGRHMLYRVLCPGEECPCPHLPPKSLGPPHSRNDLEVMEHGDSNL